MTLLFCIPPYSTQLKGKKKKHAANNCPLRLNLTPTPVHCLRRPLSNLPNLAAQIPRLRNNTEPGPPKSPSLQTVSSALPPQPSHIVRRRARRPVLAIMIVPAKPMDAVTSQEDPSRRGRDKHGREAPLLRGLDRHLDPLHQAHLGMEWHADGRASVDEVCGPKGGGVEQRERLGVPGTVAAFLEILHGLKV